MPTAAPRQPFATLPVLAIAAAVVVGLLVLAPAYGFHRDELYFIVAGRHPALGYDDQPPITPLLSAAAVALLGLEPWAVRILPALAIGTNVVLTALIARELGGSRRGQALAAVVIAISGYLAAGHLGVTATYDLLTWATILWLFARILRGGDPRLWLLVGLVAGVGLLNKHLVLFLAGGLAVGLVIHRRDILRTRWPWLGAGLALLIWLPNLAWQVANGLPQLEMARNIASDDGFDPGQVIVEILLLAGPLLWWVMLLGLWRLYRAPELRPFRAFATAFLAILGVILVSGGKSYYVVGAIPPLVAAGALAVDRWLGFSRPREAVFGLLAVASLSIVAVLTLPVLPAATLADTPIPDLYGESVEQIGWPELVSTVDGVVEALPRPTGTVRSIFTSNYGEQGALELLGHGVAPVVFRPQQHVVVGPATRHAHGPGARGRLGPVVGESLVHRLPGGGADHERRRGAERGEPRRVLVCTGLARPWSVMWPGLHHLD